MSEELKPCPFCGGKAHLVIGDEFCHIRCHQCGATGALADAIRESDAIAAWNRRARAEQAERERDEAREAAHYANGTAELAMKHRDTAEARVKELEDRLRCGEGSDRERQLLRKLEKLVTRVRALEAALLKVTCDQAATPADWHEARAALKGE